jgi:hypothetical protein
MPAKSTSAAQTPIVPVPVVPIVPILPNSTVSNKTKLFLEIDQFYE